MSLAILTCRESGHAFPWSKATRERIRIAGVDHVQTTRVCACCTSERVDVYDASTLRLISRRYQLVDGYAGEPGTGRVTREEVRRELFGRLP